MIYLFIRILTIKKDSRFDGVRENFWKFFQFWTFQGVAAYVIFMGGFLFFLQGTSYWIGGALVFMLGLIIETISDYQKFTFKNNPKNKNKWIETGLWKYIRHPNYTGEILVWLGIFLYVVPGLTLWYQLLAFISPLTIFILLRFVSGVPTLHKFEDAKWGKNPAFKAYKKRTGLFLPKLW
jgi:steroid 5-alpha reductase family enzyme